MSSFTGRKVKDSYGEALKVDTGDVNGTSKDVVSGLGTASALQVSTSKVRSTGNLEADGNLNVVGNASIDTINQGAFNDVLVVDGSGEVFKRSLSETDLSPGYDSGWISAATYGDQGYGMPKYDDLGANYIQYRVINRTVFLRGSLYIPLNNGSGGYVNPYSTAYSVVGSGVDTTSSGWSITGGNTIVTPPLTGNSVIYPDNNYRFNDLISSRIIKEKNSSDGLRLYTVLNFYFNTDGSISLQTIRDIEEPSTSGINPTRVLQDQRRYMVSNVEADDYNLDWTNYKTSSNGSSTFNNTWGHGTRQYSFDFDGTDANFLGGITVNVDGLFYQIDSSTTIEAIRASITP